MYVVQLHVQLHVQLLYMYYIGMMMCVLLLLQVMFNVTNSVITMNGFNNYNLAILTLILPPLFLSQMYSCGSLGPKMKRGGGCMDH